MALDLLNLLVIVSTVSLSVALPTAVRVVRQGVDGTGDNAHGPPCELHSSILGNSTDADTVFHEMDVAKATCQEWRADDGSSGVYRISPTGACEFNVFCDTCLSEGEGWIVVQRRMNNTVAFHNKNWEDYKKGFGDYRYNYWIGLEKLHAITSSGDYELFVGFSYFLSNTLMRTFGIYGKFSVSDESQNYKVTIKDFSSSRSGSMPNVDESVMLEHDGKEFSTPDSGHDNDGIDHIHCARHAVPNYGLVSFGGWWFGLGNNNCLDVNLNGKYYNSLAGQNGPNRMDWQDVNSPLKSTIMAIKKV